MMMKLVGAASVAAVLAAAAPASADVGAGGSASLCVRSWSVRDLNPFDGIRAALRLDDSPGMTNTLYEFSPPPYNTQFSFERVSGVAGLGVRGRTILGDGGESSVGWDGYETWAPGSGASPLTSSLPSVFLSPHSSFSTIAIGRVSGYVSRPGAVVGVNVGLDGEWFQYFQDVPGRFSITREFRSTITNDTNEWLEIFPSYRTGLDIFAPAGPNPPW